MEAYEINNFFRLLRLGIGTEVYSNFPDLTEEEWQNIYDMGKKQSVCVLLLEGINCLPKEKRPEEELIMQLTRIKVTVERVNRKLDQKAVKVCNFFRKYGFSPILLKGQGVATLYPKPELRTPGDIDIWLPDGREKVTKFIKDRKPEAEVLFHHIHLIEKDGMDVEIHNVPTLMYNPFTHRIMMKLFKRWKDMGQETDLPDGAGKVVTPCDEMNRIYMLAHKYRHLFTEGIGLKQVIDYLFLMKKGFNEEERLKTVNILKELKMTRFCSAVMYILVDVLGMKRKHLIMEPDKAAGKRLLDEIMIGGNFGIYDERIDREVKNDSIQSFLMRNKRNMRFITDYPHEVLWGPYFKIYNWFWRRKKHY